MRLGVVLLLAVASFTPASAADDPTAEAAQKVLKTFCFRCHSGDGSSSGYAFDVTSQDSLTKKNGDEEPVVVGSSLKKSSLWDAIQKRMPQKNSSEAASFTDEHRTIIKKWIEAGAKPFPQFKAREFVPLKAVLASIRDDLAKPANRDRKTYLRYFTLTHLHNDSRVSDEDMRYHRAALSKTLNSLSWKEAITLPRAVDKHETVFAIDLRELDWDNGNRWMKILDQYPYGLRFGNHPETELRDLDAEIRMLSKNELPWLRADWFIATAARPALYYQLLDIPTDAKELEKKLGVDIPMNFAKDKLVRAAFAKSGVSGQNRMLERHQSLYGAYWKSYDFLPDSGRANIVRFPLGPLDLYPKGQHPFAGQAFNHDGGEIIFNLPNGLQGYALVDGKDRRINAGPIDVVSDDKMTSGTPLIVNALSCMACHRHGMISFKDTLRESAAVFGDAEEKVKRLYPVQADMDKLVERDRKKFLEKLEEAIGPFLQVGPDKGRKITDFLEPVNVAANYYRPYRRAHLDLQSLAVELYFQKPDDLIKALGDRRFKELGLDALRKPGGLITRAEWEATDEGDSLMQLVARELRFTPFGK